MRLVIVGGGGFRIPGVYEAIAASDAPVRVDELVLYDVAADRLATIRSVVDALAPRVAHPPAVTSTTDLREALEGADFVFSAVRIGGSAGRVVDERVALAEGLLGQETVGPGGLAYALRTLPFMVDLAETIRDVAPDARVINFTNPAGIVTEAMRSVLGDRVVGICDTPIGLLRRASRAAGVELGAEASFDYVGLNHLGWLRSIRVDGRDVLPEVLASDEALEEIEEARILGFDWVRAIRALPNEYVYYYALAREAREGIRAAAETRGEFLDRQQAAFFADPGADPLERWLEVRHERESSYMAESRADDEERHAEDVDGGGYQRVALDLMAALWTGRPATMILNVANGGLVPELPDGAVIETGCRVDADGVHPLPLAPLRDEMLGLVTSVKAAERLVIAAVREGSRELAWRAFAAHPLVDSIAVARRLVDGYSAHFPQIGEMLR